MKTILITGSSGFIGKALCKAFLLKFRVIALDNRSFFDEENNYISVIADIDDEKAIHHVCKTYQPDVVIHCAGISSQNVLPTKKKALLYDRINVLATEKLAHIAASINPKLYFIFLSSVSVYGENQDKDVVKETDHCFPTSLYAESKLSAEKRLTRLYNQNVLKTVDILRLALVYNSESSVNLEKRVFAPQKIFYLCFGSGKQKISALAMENLVGFIAFRLNHMIGHKFCRIINICDDQPYSFNEIIEVFRKTKYQPQRRVIKIPLCIVGLPILMIRFVLRKNSIWVQSFYNKLAKDLVFDNKRMLDTGFKPILNLKSIFLKNGM